MGYTDDATPTATMNGTTTAADSAFKTRASWTTANKTLSLISPIWHELFQQERLMIPLINISLEFTKSSKEFAILANRVAKAAEGSNPAVLAANYGFSISEMKLYIRRVRTTPSVKLAIESKLTNENAKYPLTNCALKPFYLDANTKSITIENIFSNKGVPRYTFIAFTKLDSYRGSYGSNPYVFNHHNLVSLKLSFGSHTWPSIPLLPKYAAGNDQDYTLAYMNLMQSFKNDTANSLLTYAQFRDNYCIYLIDLGKFSTIAQDHVTPRVDATARLDVDFLSTVATSDALVMLLYTEHDVSLEIDSARNVKRDYIL